MSRVKIPRPRDWASSSLQSAWKLSSFVDFTSLKDFEWRRFRNIIASCCELGDKFIEMMWQKWKKSCLLGHFTLFCIYTKTSPLEGLLTFPPSKKNCWKINTLQSSLSSSKSLFCYAHWGKITFLVHFNVYWKSQPKVNFNFQAKIIFKNIEFNRIFGGKVVFCPSVLCGDLVDSIKNFKLGGEDEGICYAKWHVKCKISPFSSSQVVFASVQTI